MTHKPRRLVKIILKIVLVLGYSTLFASCNGPILVKSPLLGSINKVTVPLQEEPDSKESASDKNLAGEEMADESEGENQEPLCNGPDRLSVLVLGIDEHAQSDAIRMVMVDFISGEVDVLAIPRDFYVKVVGFEDQKIYQGRINATFGFGEKYWGLGSGVISLSENLAYNFGVEFDRYVVLHFDNVGDYIDEIGGVDIYLDRAQVDDKFYFSSGWHHFDGETAVNFMRMRKLDDDFHRIDRQTMLLKIFYTKVMDELEPIQQVKLALKGLVDSRIKTNFIPNDISSLICLARLIDSEDVNFIEIPKDMYHSFTTSSGGAVQIPHDNVLPSSKV